MKKITKLLSLILVLCSCLILAVGCSSSYSVGSITEKLLKKGYEIEVLPGDSSSLIEEVVDDIDDIDGNLYALRATKASRDIIVIIFEEKETAKTLFEEYEDEIDTIAEYYDIDVVELKDNLIIVGTTKAYKDLIE